MKSSIRRYCMVVAVDDSEYADIVIEHALDQAVRHDCVDIHFLTVVDDEDEVDGAGRGLAARLADEFGPFADASGDRRVRLHVRVGKPTDEIIRFAGEFEADLLVIGRFGAHHRWRSTSAAIVEASPCPTLVVGLVEHAVAQPQCPDCAAVRAATDAEVLFCERHRGDAQLHSSSLMPWASGLTHGRLW